MKRDLNHVFASMHSNAKFKFQSSIFYKDEQMKIAQMQGCQQNLIVRNLLQIDHAHQ